MGVNIATWLHDDRWPRDVYELFGVPRLTPRSPELSRRASLIRDQLDALDQNKSPSTVERVMKLREYVLDVEATLRDAARWRKFELEVIADLSRKAGQRFGTAINNVNTEALVRWLLDDQNVHPSRAEELVAAVQASIPAGSSSAKLVAKPPRPSVRPAAALSSAQRAIATSDRAGQTMENQAPSSLLWNPHFILSAVVVVTVFALMTATAAAIHMMRQAQSPLGKPTSGAARVASANEDASGGTPRTSNPSGDSESSTSGGEVVAGRDADAARPENVRQQPRNSPPTQPTPQPPTPQPPTPQPTPVSSSPSPVSPEPSPPQSPSPSPPPPQSPGHLPPSTKFLRHGETPLAMAWRRSANQLAVAGHAGVVVVWDVEKGTEVVRLRQQGSVRALAWSENGKWLASGGEDPEAVIWNTLTWAVAVKCPVGTGRGVRSLTWLPGDRQIAVGTSDGGIRYFEGDTGRLRHESVALASAGATISLGVTNSNSRTTVISGHVDGSVGLWELNAKGPSQLVAPCESPLWPKLGSQSPIPLSSKSFAPCEGEVFFGVSPAQDGKRLAIANGDIELWQSDGTLLVRERVLPGINDQHERDGYRCAAWSAGDRKLAAGYCEGELDVWDARTWRLTHSFKLPAPANGVAWSAGDSPRIAVALESQEVLVIPVNPDQTSSVVPRVPIANAIQAAEQFQDDRDWPGYCRARSLATMHLLNQTELNRLDRLHGKASRAALDRLAEISREGVDFNEPAGTLEIRQLFEVDPAGEPGREALVLLRRPATSSPAKNMPRMPGMPSMPGLPGMPGMPSAPSRTKSPGGSKLRP